VTEQATKTGFDEEALAALPSPAPFVEALRKQAFQEFLAQPIPSQETEEWRYTDLSEFSFDLRPFSEGGRADNLDEVPGEVLEAAGVQDVLTKSLGTANPHNVVNATLAALRGLRDPEQRRAELAR